MDQLIARIRRVSQLQDISEDLLMTLLKYSERIPDRVANGVILFQQDDIVTYWYLLLSGEVELYQTVKLLEDHYVDTLSAGCLFGEIDLSRHSCSARVKKTAEFVRISQQHFLSTYNDYVDKLQHFIVVIEDLISGRTQPKQPSTSTPRVMKQQLNDTYKLDSMKRALPSEPFQYQNGYSAMENDWPMPVNLFELSHSLSTESRIYETGLSLKRIMQLRAPTLIRDRFIQNVFYGNSMIGSEMTKWLEELFAEVFNATQRITILQIVGIWQSLLENNIIAHVTNEQPFKDKILFYKWTIEDPYEEIYRRLAKHPNMQIMLSGGLILPSDWRDLPPNEAQPPTLLELQNALLFLCTIGPDSLFKIILRKPRYDRTLEELEFVYEELKYVKALSHLSTSVKRELASIIRYECYQNAGTVLFHQGELGHSWYIILKGSVDVSIHTKGFSTSVKQTTLREQDDFGKLALVSDSPRPATIATVEDNCEFLVIDKDFFAKILRDVETNTVRLKEHGQDVLVLEKINYVSSSQQQATGIQQQPCGLGSQCCYSVMAGLPEKMIEYILETRMDAVDGVDTFLEDFILTHIIYMPSQLLCNYLKTYYMRRINPTYVDGLNNTIEVEFSLEQQLIAKRRVISFLSTWEMVLGINFFLDSVANSFVEEMYCCVIEDSKFIPNMLPIVQQITTVRQLRENAMRLLSRHSAVILDCGVYCIQAPAPDPILPFLDSCNQCVYLSDTTYITISVRLDKTSNDIAELARQKLRCANANEECFLIEVKSSGERVVYAPTEVGVPTMLSLNGKLYVVFKDEIDSLIPIPEQNGPTEPVYHSVMDIMTAEDIAQQMYLFHMELFEATDELELIFQIVGRDQFQGRVPVNLDILLRRFNEVQYWTTTEVLLAASSVKRLNILKKLIKIAVHAKENKDLLTLFAVILGLSNISVSRLTQLWQRLPSRFRRVYAEFEALLDPSRNHRAYRIFVSKMTPPFIPFIPLLLKDLNFIHEGNKTYFAGLVNFEKMHMIANLLRDFRNCKSKYTAQNSQPKNPREIQSIVRNFRVIDNQRRLTEISYQIQPPSVPPP